VDEAQAAIIPIASTGSYDTFALTNGTVNLTAGEHRLRLILSGYFDLDYIEFGAMNTLPPLPGAPGAPRDLDGDGRYDDVNGNGRVDFADITLYFNRMDWIAANEPVAAFDYNGNGRIDFADVTALFATL
jgi:PKD repeat protein